MNQNSAAKPGNTCAVTDGTLPGTCAPLAFPFIAMQGEGAERYDTQEGLKSGTLFPGLNLPFRAEMESRFPSEPTALIELMSLDFAIDEMALYLDTHPNDAEAVDLFHTYIRLAQQGRQRFEELYGPLQKQYISQNGKYTWTNDPWPWELVEVKR